MKQRHTFYIQRHRKKASAQIPNKISEIELHSKKVLFYQ